MRWLKRGAEQPDDRLDAELRFHIERQIADYVRDGCSADKACGAQCWNSVGSIGRKKNAATFMFGVGLSVYGWTSATVRGCC